MITVIIVAIVGVFYAIYTYYKWKDLPPGPYGLPIIGYAPFLGAKPYEKMKNLSSKYGSVFSINIGNTLAIVVNDSETIREVLISKGSSFSGRAINYVLDTVLQRKDKLTVEGAIFRENKRFLINAMKEIGFEMNSIEGSIMQEIDILMKLLEEKNGKPVQLPSLLFAPTINVLWRMVAGKRFDFSDKDTVRFKTALQTTNHLMEDIQILNIFPFLKYIAPDMTRYSKLCSERNVMHEYLRKEVESHWKIAADDDDGNKDLMSRYIVEIKKRQRSTSDDGCPPYNKDTLIDNTYDLFHAGSISVQNFLSWAFLYMALWPNIQENVHEELDRFISKESYLPYSSKECVPYTMATLHEIQRFASTAPLGAPHATMKDVTIKGYQIKSGTTVITNLWAMHNDKKVWGDPECFRPERFLDNSGKVKKHESLLPFGAGPRLCVAKTLAEVEMFSFFTSLMHRFSFETIPGVKKPTLEPIFTETLQAQDYSLLVKLRKH